jgi:hypothetical protein
MEWWREAVKVGEHKKAGGAIVVLPARSASV